MAVVISSSASPIESLPVNFLKGASNLPQGRSGVAMKCRKSRWPFSSSACSCAMMVPRMESLKLK